MDIFDQDKTSLNIQFFSGPLLEQICEYSSFVGGSRDFYL